MSILNITLPPETFALVLSGAKKVVSTVRNPRKDRYFHAKTPAGAMINGKKEIQDNDAKDAATGEFASMKNRLKVVK